MHVKAKTIATAGLLVAFTIVMMIFSSVIESNTLYLLAAASFCVGIAVREWGVGLGFVFWVASVLTNFMAAPNKMYCFTFAFMGLYLILYEWMWKLIADAKRLSHRMIVLWVGKYALFNLFYVPTVFLAPHLLFQGKINGLAIGIFLGVGQIAFFVYDMAYRYFQSHLWSRIRGRLLG